MEVSTRVRTKVSQGNTISHSPLGIESGASNSGGRGKGSGCDVPPARFRGSETHVRRTCAGRRSGQRRINKTFRPDYMINSAAFDSYLSIMSR